MGTVGSIGVGLFILIILWIIALIVFVISAKLQANFGWVALFIVTLITIILVALPIELKGEGEEDYGRVVRNKKYFRLNQFFVVKKFKLFIEFDIVACHLMFLSIAV